MKYLTLLFPSASARRTQVVAATLAKFCCAGDVICLSGSLAAGKTTFAKGFAHGLGLQITLTSPSYPIILDYPGSPGLCHMDWYRLSDENDVRECGAIEYFSIDWICLIEWWQRAGELLPEQSILVSIENLANDSRLIKIEVPVSLLEQSDLEQADLDQKELSPRQLKKIFGALKRKKVSK